MILGLHNMVDAVAHYSKEHTTSEGAWWILAIDGILLIPLVFAVFFYPVAVLVGVVATLTLTLGFAGLVRVLQAHRHRAGHH